MTALLPRRFPGPPPPGMAVRWQLSQPELACVANSVSLMMPHVEPYVIRSIRRTLGELPEAERPLVESYLRQEGAHHRAHRPLNDLVVAEYPAMARLDRMMARTYAWLERRSTGFGVAFAAGAETVAYATARWVERHRRELFDGAEPWARDLFIWHLAEEVEHKSVAFDCARHLRTRRRTHAAGLVLSMLTLAVFTIAGTTYLLAKDRRLWHPLSCFRLTRWSIGYCFELLPTMAVSLLARHHPAQLSDPQWYGLWLAERDGPESALRDAGEEAPDEVAPRLG